MTGVRAAGVLLLMFICVGCGETFRPVATPIAPNPPNPGFAHVALVISSNGPNNPGASTSIDVSGDTAVSRSTVGLMPVHAAVVQNAARVYVANSGDGTVSVFSSAAATPVLTVSLPSGPYGTTQASPVFVNTTETDAVWVADAANNQVDEILTSNNVAAYYVTVGTNPVALAETPDQQKLFVANRGNGGGGSVTSINPFDRSVNPPITNATWVSPVAVVVRSDSARAYVLDQGRGIVSAIDTFAGTVVNSVSVGVGANFMVYDPTLNRVYVSNPVANAVTFLDVSSDGLAAVVIPVAHPVSVAALPDGTRAYISSGTVSAGRVTSEVTVINATDGSIKNTIPLTTVVQVCASNPSELQIIGSADSTRIYVGNCDAGNVSVITTLTDSVELQIPAPQAAAFGPDGSPLPQNPVFMVAGP
jgi:DNA-binding beta-propeller fold protein YncE